MKIHPTLSLGLFLLVLITFSSCATIFSDSEDEVHFDSSPLGATVTMNGKELGKTPLTIKLKRKLESSAVTFSKNGYLPHSVNLAKDIAPAALFNFGFITTTLGATSWGVDAMSGKMIKYQERSYVVELVKRESSFYKTSPLEFSILQFDRLQMEVASGMGESFSSLCRIYGFGPVGCEAFYSRVRTASDVLSTAPHALDWFNTVDVLAAI